MVETQLVSLEHLAESQSQSPFAQYYQISQNKEGDIVSSKYARAIKKTEQSRLVRTKVENEKWLRPLL